MSNGNQWQGNTPARTLNVPPPPATFKHPGLLHSADELAFVKKKIQAGEEPWASAFEQMKTSPWAELNYKPKPHVSISSGFLGAGAKEGGVADASRDSKTAYTQALMWVFTGNEFKLGDDSSSYKDTNLNTHFITRHWNKAPEEAFIDGLSGEIFRDLGHADLGFSSLAGVAEVAWHQGIDLYALEAKRIIAGVELLSSLRIDEIIPPAFYRIRGTPIQSSMDLIYNHYHYRMGIEMPKTLAFMKKAVRPSLKKTINGAPGWCWVPVELGVRAENVVWPISSNIAWELLMHADQAGPRDALTKANQSVSDLFSRGDAEKQSALQSF